MHQQHLQLRSIAHEDLAEAGGQHMLRRRVRAITRRGQRDVALEPAARAVINAAGLAPRGLGPRVEGGVREVRSGLTTPLGFWRQDASP